MLHVDEGLGAGTEQMIRKRTGGCRIVRTFEQKVHRLPRRNVGCRVWKRRSIGVRPMRDHIVVDDPQRVSDGSGDGGFASVPGTARGSWSDVELEDRVRGMAVVLAQIPDA